MPRAPAGWGGNQLWVYGALFALVALTFSTHLESQFSLPKLLVIRSILPVLAVVWLVRFMRGETRALPRSVAITVAALIAWWAVTTVTAVHPMTAVNGAHGRYNGLVNQLLCVLLFLSVATIRFTGTEVERLARFFVAALIPVAGYSLAQYAGWDPFVWPGQRSASTIGNPVVLAAILGLAMPFATVFLILAPTASERWLWGAALAILVAGAITTLSRGPLLASVGSLVLLAGAVTWEYRRRVNRVFVVAATVVTVVVLAAGYRQVIEVRGSLVNVPKHEADQTILDRLNTYSAALEIVRDHPVTGVGLENFAVVYPRYRSAASESLTPDVIPTMVHNGYLQAAATTGIPGLLAYLAVVGSVMGVLVRAARASLERRERWFMYASLASIIAYLVQDLTGWLEISLSAFFWLVLGLGLSAASLSRPGMAITPVKRRVSLAIISGVIAITVGLAVQTAAVVRLDFLMWNAQALNPRLQWPALESRLSSARASGAMDAAYLDKAGLRYAERYAVSGTTETYQEAVSLFRQARDRDPFNPYFRIHRLALESLALSKKATGSDSVEQMVTELLALDPNNGAVHEAIARLRMAQGRQADALETVARAKRLRPAFGRYDELEGDLRRATDLPAAAEAYRNAIAKFKSRDLQSWIGASHKAILMLLEQRQPAEAARQAEHLVREVPDDAIGWSLLGHSYLAVDDRRALDAFETALRINPDDQNAKQSLAEARETLRTRG